MIAVPDIDPPDGVDDYAETMDRFGIEPIETVADRLPGDKLVRRGILFGHRDLGIVLDARDRGEGIAVMTGLMPSGPFHLGHKTVVDHLRLYQEMGASVTLCVADVEAYLTRDLSLAGARRIAVEEYLPNYAALGIDIESADVYFQSSAGNDDHLRSKRFARHLTQNQVEATYGDADPARLVSALTEAADIVRPQAKAGEPVPTVVPVGIDQDPHVRLTRDVVDRFRDADYAKPASTYHRFMRGLRGGKMSSSDPASHIALSDPVKEARRKLAAAKTGGRATVAEHREKGAAIEEDVVFELLSFHLIDDDRELERIREAYAAGELLSGELKDLAAARLDRFLTEHAERRAAAAERVDRLVAERIPPTNVS